MNSNNLSRFSDPYPYVLDMTMDVKEGESSSTSADCATSDRRGSDWEEDVILAASRPKKRAGRRVFKETRHPVFRGVRGRNKGKWVCELREPNKKTRIWLGTYPTAEMAARAHDVAALALRGRAACLNFADSAWRLPVPASGEAKDIRAAAAAAAEAFRPREFGGCGGVVSGRGQGRAAEEERQGQKVLFMDEDFFDLPLPRLFADLAQGLLLPPPMNFLGSDDLESQADMSLWSYSI